ncbi:MAG TPA: bifunctional transaldolase/phosoglucose isomerase [Phycisphaerae bacterium]|nr:bifunctional transaldolase/phosoglucose isomerase [Phycisphaerae bacterium]
MAANNKHSSQRGSQDRSTDARAVNPLRELQKYGQSVWLDYIRRHLILSGELQRLVTQDDLRGVTSNPTIFEKALSGSTDYNDLFCGAGRRRGQDPRAFYEALAIRDLQESADILRPVYEQTERRDGYVSLEVSPYLAHDTRGTVAEARRLWQQVERPNLMIKVPGTPEGVPAVSQLIAEGINVNITLLFAREMYEQVAYAYMSGLESLAAQGSKLDRVASVASFFVSRIDTAVDQRVHERLKATSKAAEQDELRSLLGTVAIANAKLAYETFKEIHKKPRWRALADRGARVQRLLWASTSTKNPAYRDVMYVEELIGPDTVNTMPPATMDAFREHGRVRPSLEEGVDEARTLMRTLPQVGLSMQEITSSLLVDGIRQFSVSLDKLLGVIEAKQRDALTCTLERMTSRVPEHFSTRVAEVLEEWRRDDKVRRLWTRDASLWTGHDESSWLDWLGVAEDQRANHGRFRSIAEEAKGLGYRYAVLLGMGGSSLCPEVLARVFGRQSGCPEMLVLDSTDPAEIRAMEERIDLANTLFIVSSKSGTTLEPNIFKDYFLERVKQTVGAEKAGRHFVAITDPGSELEKAAEADGFRRIFHGVPGIGGRYSALSDFGLVPAAIMGLDVPRLLERTEEMVHACASCVPPAENPGVVLGATLGTLAREGRDKVTVVASPGIVDFGAWLEQLLAESTGKDGKGLIPVDREKLGPPEVYGQDRLFIYLRMENGADARQDAAMNALEQAGQPVVRIAATDPYQLGQGFFRWEIATAVAGAILGVNAFNQPDVEASKIETRKLTAAYEKTGSLPAETSILQEGDIRLFADEKNASELSQQAGSDRSLRGYLRAHLKRLQEGDYFALLAFIARNQPHEERLQAIRKEVLDNRHIATCMGFGPRFLHSTGQAYKGGPNTGVFLQITCDDAHDLPVPGRKFTFGVVKAAQARGDFQVLAERGRRALRVHLGPDVTAGLDALGDAVRQALA